MGDFHMTDEGYHSTDRAAWSNNKVRNQEESRNSRTSASGDAPRKRQAFQRLLDADYKLDKEFRQPAEAAGHRPT